MTMRFVAALLSGSPSVRVTTRSGLCILMYFSRPSYASAVGVNPSASSAATFEAWFTVHLGSSNFLILKKKFWTPLRSPPNPNSAVFTPMLSRTSSALTSAFLYSSWKGLTEPLKSATKSIFLPLADFLVRFTNGYLPFVLTYCLTFSLDPLF